MDTSCSAQSLTFYDFLDRMRNPASLDLVRSIKSFIVSFSFYLANPENDGKRLQDFLLTMEAAIRDHPLWAGASEEEIDCAIEGLEKYVMTKLFSRTFGSPEDAKIDQEISDKIRLLQQFLRPEHLDIPKVFHSEASWLLAEKELQKINAFKAPREKLLCILNCCRVINNLLLNASMSEDSVPGADDFLPVLIYVTIKANPPLLHSNLKFIQLYRRQEKLVSEEAYYFTNLVSVKSFIVDLEAKSLSMDETVFEENMQTARLAITGAQVQLLPALKETAALPNSSSRMRNRVTQNEPLPTMDDIVGLAARTDPGPSTGMQGDETNMNEAGELTIGDVEKLLSLYKDVVKKYTNLCTAVRHLAIYKIEPSVPHLKEPNIQLEQPEEQPVKDHKTGSGRTTADKYC
ncbi:vacuolar protein sorting-associated protein 9A-like isoform X2 [Actinidia eriantha]|uniref:vacuolar protein sorting-associated protein 9A-like isoform X2 n=1 Tax=Actinidia eriantha TaxID=165200 RepID=UPI002583810A|nr:vacuolar protein sorting-associated protein 9A-like isoform X2 [Actinidia eriantha]